MDWSQNEAVYVHVPVGQLEGEAELVVELTQAASHVSIERVESLLLPCAIYQYTHRFPLLLITITPHRHTDKQTSDP